MGCCFSEPVEESRHAVYIHPNNQFYPVNTNQGQLYMGPIPPQMSNPIPFYPAPPAPSAPLAPLAPYNQPPLPYNPPYPSAIPNII